VTDQRQQIGEGGQAIQAGRDVIVNQSMSPNHMMEIMTAMAKQLSIFREDAMKIVNERIDSFQQEVLEKFTEPGKANPEAFRDPDFQYLLAEAQNEFARSGDESVRDVLVDIVARRSLEKTRNRLAITLNDAATRAPLLTINEFAALSLCFMIRYSSFTSVLNFPDFCAHVQRSIIPFVPNVSTEASSYFHIQAQGCGAIEMGEVNLYEVFKGNYGGVLGKGLTRADLMLTSAGVDLSTMVMPCVLNPTNFQPRAVNKEAFLKGWASDAATSALAANLWGAFENTLLSKQELIDLMEKNVPEIKRLFTLWGESELKNLSLNTIGIAIGHANAVRVVGLTAPLEVWIK
jgi:hypothetical protein